MDSETLSQKYWEQVPHSELPNYRSPEKTRADIAAFESFLTPADRILDLGCGWGEITYALATRGYRVVGIDLSPNLIAYARQHAADAGLDVQFDVGSMTSLPYPVASFDKIVCLWGVFNHLLTTSEQVRAVDEMYRILKRGGLAFIEMGDGERKKYRQIRATVGYGPENRIWNSQYREGAPPNVLYLHDRQTLREIAQQSRFERYHVKYQNINHKRRTVVYLFR